MVQQCKIEKHALKSRDIPWICMSLKTVIASLSLPSLHSVLIVSFAGNLEIGLSGAVALATRFEAIQD